MNEAIIENYNSLVGKDDICYHLGDFSMSFQCVERFAEKLNGKKTLVMGNHDSCSPAFKHRGKMSIKDYIDVGFEEVLLEKMIELPLLGKTRKVKLHHMPYEPDDNEKADRRYMSMRPKKEDGVLLLHGHIHNVSKFNIKNKSINVGVDVWSMAPVSVAQIDELLINYDFQL